MRCLVSAQLLLEAVLIATAADRWALSAPEVISSGGRTTPVGFEPFAQHAAEVAQVERRQPQDQKVSGSMPDLGTIVTISCLDCDSG